MDPKSLENAEECLRKAAREFCWKINSSQIERANRSRDLLSGVPGRHGGERRSVAEAVHRLPLIASHRQDLAAMPELPDITSYLVALRPRIVGQPLERIVVRSPFLVRTVEPDLFDLEGM